MMNHDDSTQLSAIKHTKNQRKNEGKVMQVDAVEDRRQSSEESAISGNFAKIAKISLGLRKFCSHSENFAILAKL